MPPLSYTREQMLAILRRGESISMNGRVISDPAYLPSEAEMALAQGGEEQKQNALEQIDKQMAYLEDQRTLLTNPPGDAETVHTAFGAFPGGKAKTGAAPTVASPPPNPRNPLAGGTTPTAAPDEGGNDEFEGLSDEELEDLTRPEGPGAGQGQPASRPDGLAKARAALAAKRQRDKDEKARSAAYPPGGQPPPATVPLPQGGVQPPPGDPNAPPPPKTDQTTNPPDRQVIP